MVRRTPQFGKRAQAWASQNHVPQSQLYGGAMKLPELPSYTAPELKRPPELDLVVGYYRVKHPDGGRWIVSKWRPSKGDWVLDGVSNIKPAGYWLEVGEKVA